MEDSLPVQHEDQEGNPSDPCGICNMRCFIQKIEGTIPHPISHISDPSMNLPIYLLPWVVAVVICAAMVTYPPSVWALIGDTEGAFGIDGRLSGFGALRDNYDFEPFFGDHDTDRQFQGLLRVIAAGRPTERLSYEVQAIQSYDHTTATAGQNIELFGPGDFDLRYRAVDASWVWHNDNDSAAVFWLDRFNVKTALPKADITMGRQAITFGKAYFWNPLDVFLPFDPRQFDRDYKPGVDAIRIDSPFSAFSGINLVAAFGRELNATGTFLSGDQAVSATWYGSALLGRSFTTYGGWDLALQGGKIYGGYQLGGGTVGEIGPLQVRAEAAYFWAQDGSQPLPGPLPGDLYEDNLTAVVGVGHRFDSTLNLEFEYLFNGSGDPNNLDAAFIRFGTGASLQMSRNVTGFLVSYEFLPIVIGQMIWLHSWDDSSSNIQPLVTWSAADNIDLIVGANLNFGERPRETPAGAALLQSEFGTFPNLYFMQLKIYF